MRTAMILGTLAVTGCGAAPTERLPQRIEGIFEGRPVQIEVSRGEAGAVTLRATMAGTTFRVRAAGSEALPPCTLRLGGAPEALWAQLERREDEAWVRPALVYRFPLGPEVSGPAELEVNFVDGLRATPPLPTSSRLTGFRPRRFTAAFELEADATWR